MTFEWATWQAPLIVLLIGTLVGLGLLSRRSGDRDQAAAEGRQRDLEREREQAIEALKALETEASKMDPKDYQREREALLQRGAAVLRAMDGVSPSAGADAGDGSEEQAFRQREALVAMLRTARSEAGPDAFDAALRVATGATSASPSVVAPAWRGALYATALWALVGLLVAYANDQATARRDGGSMTGGTAGAAAPAAPAAPDFDALAKPFEARLAANPNDLEALNELTQLALSANKAQEAMQYSQRALEIDPKSPDALASKAVLTAMVGMADRALETLEEALAVDPDHPRSLTYKGLLLMEQGQFAAAVPVLERAVALQPGVAPLQGALQQARQRAGLGAPSAPPAAAGGEVVVSGRLYLAGDAQLTGNETLFISLRDPAGGPPLAAKRLQPTTFPVDFTVTTQDAIAMGGAPRPFPAMMSINARLDGDGNAMTREGLPEAGAGGVEKGTTGLKLTLE